MNLVRVPLLSCLLLASPALAPLEEAQRLYRTGDLNGALESYQALLRTDPRAEPAQAGLVRVYLKQHKVEEAYAVAATALNLTPASPHARVALAEVYLRQAAELFEKVVGSGAAEARAYLGLARVRALSSMYKSAKEFAAKAYEIDAADPDVQRFWIGLLEPEQLIPAAEAYLSGPTNDDPDERETMRQSLDVLKERQRHPERVCRVVGPPAAAAIELTPLLLGAGYLQGYGISARVDGRKATLLLDTGASGILVNASIAEKAGIEPVVRGSIRGVGNEGKSPSYFGWVRSIRLGDVELQDCLVHVASKRVLVGDDGIIGTDVFEQYRVGIDLPHRKLRLATLPAHPDDPADSPKDRYVATEMKNYTRVYRSDQLLLVPTRVDDTPPRLFAIDTGANTNVISTRVAREVTRLRHDSGSSIEGASGRVDEVYRADKATLQFSHYSQQNQEMVTFDLSMPSKSDGVEVSGLLGMSTLRMFRIEIDYRDGLVDLVFDKEFAANSAHRRVRRP
ncbi:MAG TPA: aspartyl protease family protein [Candidatus Polarisedimenticolaceae bacterium]|nr:aspartyl protease family protein [Candidatus Polarisedimenticolaceae bacterium]